MGEAAALKSNLCENESKDFVRNHLFSNNCWLMDQSHLIRNSTTYEDMKQTIAKSIDINPNQVSLIGSAKMGYSLAPGKPLRKFDPTRSDIDIVIASEELFDSIWSQMVQAHYQGYIQYCKDHARQIFCKFIVLKGSSSYKSSYLRELASSLLNLNRAVSEVIRFETEVNYRIYRSWSIAEAYHIEGIERLKREICND